MKRVILLILSSGIVAAGLGVITAIYSPWPQRWGIGITYGFLGVALGILFVRNDVHQLFMPRRVFSRLDAMILGGFTLLSWFLIDLFLLHLPLLFTCIDVALLAILQAGIGGIWAWGLARILVLLSALWASFRIVIGGLLAVVAVLLALLFRAEPITLGLLALVVFLALLLPSNMRIGLLGSFLLALVFGLASNTLGLVLTQNVLILPLWNENLRGALQFAGDISLIGGGLALLATNRNNVRSAHRCPPL
jgi:hypothetical protein